jgi:hypothetical protein
MTSSPFELELLMSFVLPFILGIVSTIVVVACAIAFFAWYFSDEEMFDEAEDLGRQDEDEIYGNLPDNIQDH